MSGFCFTVFGKSRQSLVDGKDKGKIRGIRKIGKINTYSVSCYFKNFWDLQHAKN